MTDMTDLTTQQQIDRLADFLEKNFQRRCADPGMMLHYASLRVLVGSLVNEKHVVCGDSWYTCPAATQARDGGECGNEDLDGSGCTCGRDTRLLGQLATLTLPYPGSAELLSQITPRRP